MSPSSGTSRPVVENVTAGTAVEIVVIFSSQGDAGIQAVGIHDRNNAGSAARIAVVNQRRLSARDIAHPQRFNLKRGRHGAGAGLNVQQLFIINAGVFFINALAAYSQACRRYVLSAGVGIFNRGDITQLIKDKIPGIGIEFERDCFHGFRP